MARDDRWRARWRARGLLLAWTVLGAVILAAFFLAAFFNAYSPVLVGDPGAVLLLLPLLTGLILGILLTDAEIVVAAGAGLLSAALAVVFIALFLFSPVLAGVAPADRAAAAFSISRSALSAILLFPLVVVGSVMGRGVGDLFLPSVHMRKQLEELREETRRWHDALDRMEKRPLEGAPSETAVPPPETPKEKG